jgi:hypothetical protein
MHVHDFVKVLSRVGIACGFGVREFVRDTQLFWICLIAVTASCPKVLPKFFFPPPEGRLRMPGVGLGLIESAIAQAMASFLFRSTRISRLRQIQLSGNFATILKKFNFLMIFP